MDTDPEELQFIHTFDEQTTFIGAAKAILYVSCADHDDMDVFVQLRKADKSGKILQNCNIPLEDLGRSSIEEVDTINVMKYMGPTGCFAQAIEHWTLSYRNHTGRLMIIPVKTKSNLAES